MFSYCDKRSHLEFKVCLKQSGLSIKLRGKISRAWNSVIRILTAICTKHKYNMQPRKLRMAYLVFLIIFLLQRQRALLLQQFYHFLVAEEEFRVRRRNRQMLLMFMAQMRQQNVQRRRRAWVWPRLVQKLTGKSGAKFSLEGTFQSHPRIIWILMRPCESKPAKAAHKIPSPC